MFWRKPYFYIPILLFLLNLTVGLLFINEGLFHMDSVALAMAVEKTFQTGILQPAVHGRYLAVMINAILYLPSYLLGQNADFTVRFSGVLFHALSIAAFFYFIRRIFQDNLTALLGALLLSFTPLYFIPNTYGKEHGIGLFFLLFSFILLDRAIKNRSTVQIALAALVNTCALACRESLVWTIPLFYLFTIYQLAVDKLRPTNTKSHAPKLLATFFLTHWTGLGIILYSFLGSVIQVEYTKGMLHPICNAAVSDLITSLPIILLALPVPGAIKMFRDGRKFYFSFFLLWLMLIFIYGNNIWYTPRHLDAILVPLYIFAAYALSDLYRKSKFIAGTIALTCIAGMFMYMYPMLAFRHEYNGEKRLAEYVRLRTELDAVIITEDQFPFIQYYGKRPTEWLPINGSPAAEELFVQHVNGYLLAGRPIYYTDSPYLKGYEAASLFSISKHFKINAVGGILIEDYHRPELRFRFAYQKLYKVAPLRQ
ncbi:MAG: hypothetical protein HGA80_04450 [Candidatus Omnitrophica bacterium]|nr:hypothetical protein [Candidatus Omnitrophota bacterium]